MLSWRVHIERFDIDLHKRMQEISRFEVTGRDIEKSLSLFIARSLGFVARSKFPAWRDHTKEWRNRNRERVNEVERLRRKKNPERFKTNYQAYVKKNHDRIEQLRRERRARKRLCTKVVYTPK